MLKCLWFINAHSKTAGNQITPNVWWCHRSVFCPVLASDHYLKLIWEILMSQYVWYQHVSASLCKVHQCDIFQNKNHTWTKLLGRAKNGMQKNWLEWEFCIIQTLVTSWTNMGKNTPLRPEVHQYESQAYVQSPFMGVLDFDVGLMTPFAPGNNIRADPHRDNSLLGGRGGG